MKNNRVFAKPRLIAGLVVVFALAGCASKAPAPVYDRGGQPASVTGVPVVKDTYTVKKGDTLYSIANANGMTVRELSAMNGIGDPGQLAVGQVLKVKPYVVTTAPVVSDVVVSRPITTDQVIEKRPLSSNTETLKREPKAGKEPYSDQALAQAQSQSQPKAADPVAPVAKTEIKPEIKAEAKPAETPLSGDEIAWIWPANGKMVGTFSEGGNKGVDIAGKAGDPVVAAGDGKVVYAGTGLRGLGKLVIVKHNNTYLSAYAHNQTILVKESQTVTKGQKIAEMGNTDADQVKLHFEVRRQGKPVDPLKYLPQR